MSIIPEARPVADAPAPAALDYAPAASQPERPRVWLLLLQYAVAVLLSLLAPIAVGVIIGFCMGFMQGVSGRGTEPMAEQIQSVLETPSVLIVILLLSQASFVVATWLFTLGHRGARRARLGMLPARISRAQYVTLLIGTIPVFVSGLYLAGLVALLAQPDDSLEDLWSGLSPGMTVVYLLAVSVPPGIVEETFFRGYLQRRLLLRWSPAAAIALTSVLFAIAHLNLAQAVFALPLGIWLGIIAWRTDSIWPGAVCHGVMNGVWNLFNILRAQSEFQPEGAPLAISICALVMGALLGLTASIVLLVRIGPPPSADAAFAAGNAPLPGVGQNV